MAGEQLERGVNRGIFVRASTRGLCQVHAVGVFMSVKNTISVLALAALSSPVYQHLKYPMTQIERDCAAYYFYSAKNARMAVLF